MTISESLGTAINKASIANEEQNFLRQTNTICEIPLHIEKAMGKLDKEERYNDVLSLLQKSKFSLVQKKRIYKEIINADSDHPQVVRVLESFEKEKYDENCYNVFSLLDKFEFNLKQKKRIYAAITHTDVDCPQVEKLLKLSTPFKDFLVEYTLQFDKEKVKTSKAELSTYGRFFSAFITSGFCQNNVLDLTNSMFLTKESFDIIKGFMRGELELDVDDLEDFEACSMLANYVLNQNMLEVLCKSINHMINEAKKNKRKYLVLTKYDGKLKDQHVDRILALPELLRIRPTINIKTRFLSLLRLRRIQPTIDLIALFPRLRIIDETIWRTRVNITAHGLCLGAPVDQRTAIMNLHDMFRTLKIESKDFITLVKMPKGLTLNKLISISDSSEGTKLTVPKDLLNKYGNISIDKEYSFAVTEEMLEDSKRKSKIEMQKLVERKGCTIPKLLEVLTFNIIGRTPSVLSEVEETLGDRSTYIFLTVKCSDDDSSSDVVIFEGGVGHGVVGLRRF